MTKRRYASSGRRLLVALILVLAFLPLAGLDLAANLPAGAPSGRAPPTHVLMLGSGPKDGKVPLYESQAPGAPWSGVPNCSGVVILDSKPGNKTEYVEVVQSPSGVSAPIGAKGWTTVYYLVPVGTPCP